MTEARVGRWGKNLAVRFPAEIAKAANLHDGDRIEIEPHDQEIVIRRAAPRFTLQELFRGQSRRAWRQAYAGAFDWGPDAGRENVSE